MAISSVVLVVLVLALLGFLVYLITTYIPMPAPFQQLIIVAVVVAIVLWLLAWVTGHASLPQLR